MAAPYTPDVAKAECTGHTFVAIRFAVSLRNAVKEFAQILNGEKKGRSAKEVMLELMKEVDTKFTPKFTPICTQAADVL
jgi:hypothetical protein